MSDLVERLRERSQNLWTTDGELRSNQLFKEAAAEIERLRAALRWYEEKAHLVRLIHSEGDPARAALAADGGAKARAALASAIRALKDNT